MVVVKVVVEKETGTVVAVVVVVEEEVEVVLEWVVLVLAAVAVHLDRLLELGGVHLTHLAHLRRGASRHAAGDARRARRGAVQCEGRGAAGEQREDVAPHGGDQDLRDDGGKADTLHLCTACAPGYTKHIHMRPHGPRSHPSILRPSLQRARPRAISRATPAA